MEKEIIIYICDADYGAFFGMNGFVKCSPCVIVKGNMTPERIRSTIAHELAQLLFIW